MSSKANYKRTDVEFESEGITCRGWHYLPSKKNVGGSSCIVMAHGLGGTKDSGLHPYAERFAEKGFHVIVFDYRHFGTSDGLPRQLLLVDRQIADWTAAVEFARSQDQIDSNRIGLWGTSFSGGHVITIASTDSDIAAICSQNPMLDGMASIFQVVKSAGIGQLLKMSLCGIADTIRSRLGLSPVTMPIIGKSGEFAAITGDEAYNGYMAICSETWKNEMTAQMTVTLPFYRPISQARKVTCPVLLQPCMDDSVVSAPSALKLATKLGDLVTLKKYEDKDHFDLYEGEGFELAVSDQIDFFKRTLN